MILMGIDSSTPQSSVALVTDGQVIEQAQVDPDKVSNQVLVMIDKILVSTRTKLSDLDGFCLTVGPG
ncbi:MAG: tRNA (adenosine(37)-N6)-threonylcarbamoyltransferase complex dimerization subunit type 1 TsaB, partial [Nitrospinaceae bacterium]